MSKVTLKEGVRNVFSFLLLCLPLLLSTMMCLHFNQQLTGMKQHLNSLGESLNSNNQLHVRNRRSTDGDGFTENERNSLVVIYNRVPKTGCTTIANLMFDIAFENEIYVMSYKITNYNPRLSLKYQYSFVWNITEWSDHRPALLHGHMAYISFSQFGAPEPLYINVIRDPIDRLVSHYYFRRYGDNLQKNWKRDPKYELKSFNECIEDEGWECQPEQLWHQIPFLCGMSAECWQPNSEWALEQAKRNVLTKYFLVGVTEQINDFVMVLEANLPTLFKGLTEKLEAGQKSHMRSTSHKDPLTEKSLNFLKSSLAYKMEQELYDFTKDLFNKIKDSSTHVDQEGRLIANSNRTWQYYKIKAPK